MVLLDEEGQPTEFKGKWYAGGDNIYVLVPSDDLANRRLVVWQIVDISKNQFRVRVWQDEDPAVWRRMKPIPRPPVDWSDMPIPEVEVNP